MQQLVQKLGMPVCDKASTVAWNSQYHVFATQSALLCALARFIRDSRYWFGEETKRKAVCTPYISMLDE